MSNKIPGMQNNPLTFAKNLVGAVSTFESAFKNRKG